MVGSAATNGTPDFVYVQGRYAYTANEGSNVLQTFDISNPASPTSLGYTGTGSGADSLYVQGRYAYVVNSTADTLQTFDLGGSYIQQLEAGGAEVGTLAVDNNENVAGDANVQGGLTVGQSIQADGDLGVTGNEEILNSSTTALQVANFGGTNLLAVNTSSPTVSIGVTGSTATSSTIHIADTTGNAAQTVTVGSTKVY